MANAVQIEQGIACRPALATTYEGGDPVLLNMILPLVDYIEITPDSIAQITDDGCGLNPSVLAEFQSAGGMKKAIVHGVGLSIASAEGFSEKYIRLLDDVFSHFDVLW